MSGQPLHDLIGVDALIGLLEQLPEGGTELGCHPSLGSELATMYSNEHEREVETLCDPRVRVALEREGIEFRSFRELPERAWRE